MPGKTVIPLDRFPCGCGVGSADGVFGYDPCPNPGCSVGPTIEKLAKEANLPVRLVSRAAVSMDGPKEALAELEERALDARAQALAEEEERRKAAMREAAKGLEPAASRPLIQQWMDLQVKRIHNDDDLIVAITGDERRGKSTLAFQLATYMDPSFDPAKQITFSGDDFSRVGSQLGKYRAVVLDEAIRGGFSRDAASEVNKKLAKFLTVCGERNLIGVICWPKLRWLDPILKEHRCKWNLHVERRFKDHAVAVLRLLRDDERVFDPPMEVFRFPFPRASGPRWKAYKDAKARFVVEVGHGQDVRNQVRNAVLATIQEQVRPTVRKLLAAGPALVEAEA